MADSYESFLFYQSWYEASQKLDPERQTKAIFQIIRYGLYGEIPDNSDDLLLDVLLASWIPQIDMAKKKRKGGAPKGNKNAVGNKGGTGRPKKTQPKTQPFNENGNENGKVNANSNDNSKGKSHQSAIAPAPDKAGDEASGSNDEWSIQ